MPGKPLAAIALLGLARHQNLAPRLRRLRAFHEVEGASDLGGEERARIELGRIDVEREHAARPAALEVRGAVAGERAAEQFAHQREARALVLAERADRAGPVPVIARPRPARSRRRARAGRAERVPSAEISASAGSGLPPWLATRTLPSATSEVAKSSSTGSCPRAECRCRSARWRSAARRRRTARPARCPRR